MTIDHHVSKPEIFAVGEKVWWVLTYSGFTNEVTVTEVGESSITVLTSGGALMDFPKANPANPQGMITHHKPITPELKRMDTYWEVFTDFL